MRIEFRSFLLPAFLVLTLISAPVAYAELADVGPIDPVGGYPQWYMDTNGVALEMCTDVAGFCVPDPVDPNNPASVAAGFGDEAFYWAGEATANGANGESCLLVLALEAAWGGAGTPAPGRQIVFSRVRLRCTGLQAGGAYTLVTPFQDRRIQAQPDAVNGPFLINFTSDQISNAANGFSTPLRSPNVGPFLTAANAPAGFLGNAVGLSTVTGGTNGNSFSLLSPGGATVVSTNLFTIQGKLATNGGLQGVGATLSRNLDGTGTIAVRASSIGGQRIFATGVGATATRLAPIAGRVGRYSASIPIAAGDVFTPLTVVNRTDASRPSRTLNQVSDVVTIQSATFDGATLSVRASSSDQLPRAQGGPRLEVLNGGQSLGFLNARGVFNLATTVGPARITVRSTGGGSDSARVVSVP